MKINPHFTENPELQNWLNAEQVQEFKTQCLRVWRDFWPDVAPEITANYAQLNTDQRVALSNLMNAGGDIKAKLAEFDLVDVRERTDLIKFKKQLALVRDKTVEQIKLIQLVVKLIHETDKVPEVHVLYQDENIIVLDKQAGLLVHPFKKHTHDRYTLMSLTRNKIGKFVYPVHRLDRSVSGVVVMALENKLVKPIQDIWHDEESVKEYITLVRGDLEDEGVIDFPLTDENGIKKESQTSYWVLERFGDLALARVEISTGRKHQIRRHFSRIVTPVVGDTEHGKGDVNFFFREHFGFDRLFLHHHKLRLKNPFGDGILEFISDLPAELKGILERLRGGEVVFKRVRKETPDSDQ